MIVETSIDANYIMELPPIEDLAIHEALPNDIFASDHVSIMCEFAIWLYFILLVL